MSMYKNSLTRLSKVLVASAGCMVIALGLMLPAYGQGVTNPVCPSGMVPTAATSVTTDDEGDPSSFAAGCNAEAQTDGSIAIGDNAKVESYMITTPGALGQATHNYDPDGDGTAPSREVSVRNGMIYETGENGDLIGTLGDSTFETDNPAYKIEKRTGDDAPDTMVTRGASGIAIGTGARTRGRESIAIGARAKVVRVVSTPGTLGQATHNYDPDGDGTDPSREVSVRDGMIYETGEDGALIGTLGDSTFEADNPAYKIEKRTGDDAPDTMVTTPVERAVAIGADSSVTGDNGIAIGAGVTAGENQIVIGTADQSAIIGGVDLAGIATNATGIATNRSGIAIAIALTHLPSVSAGDRGSWGIAAGSFDGKTAIAVGMTYLLEGKKQIKVGISTSGGETAGGIGFGMGF